MTELNSIKFVIYTKLKSQTPEIARLLFFFVLVCDSGDFSASFALTASAGRERMLGQASRYVPSLGGSPPTRPPQTTTPAFMLRWNLDGAVK